LSRTLASTNPPASAGELTDAPWDVSADHVRDIETVAYIGSDRGTGDQHVFH
jgi:hypothetical protein